MGHKVGWLLYAGMAGGADIILIPEIYNIKTIKVIERTADNKPFSIAMAEGAKSIEEAEMSKKTSQIYNEMMPIHFI